MISVMVLFILLFIHTFIYSADQSITPTLSPNHCQHIIHPTNFFPKDQLPNTRRLRYLVEETFTQEIVTAPHSFTQIITQNERDFSIVFATIKTSDSWCANYQNAFTHILSLFDKEPLNIAHNKTLIILCQITEVLLNALYPQTLSFWKPEEHLCLTILESSQKPPKAILIHHLAQHDPYLHEELSMANDLTNIPLLILRTDHPFPSPFVSFVSELKDQLFITFPKELTNLPFFHPSHGQGCAFIFHESVTRVLKKNADNATLDIIQPQLHKDIKEIIRNHLYENCQHEAIQTHILLYSLLPFRVHLPVNFSSLQKLAESISSFQGTYSNSLLTEYLNTQNPQEWIQHSSAKLSQNIATRVRKALTKSRTDTYSRNYYVFHQWGLKYSFTQQTEAFRQFLISYVAANIKPSHPTAYKQILSFLQNTSPHISDNIALAFTTTKTVNSMPSLKIIGNRVYFFIKILEPQSLLTTQEHDRFLFLQQLLNLWGLLTRFSLPQMPIYSLNGFLEALPNITPFDALS